MNHAARNATRTIVALILLASAGCATQSPAARYKTTVDAYNALNASFIAAANAGLLTDEQIVATKPLWTAGDKQLAILQQHRAGDATVTEAALATLANIIDSIQAWMATTQRKE